MVVRSRLAAPASRPANKRPPQTNALTFGRRARPVTLGPLAGGDNLGDIYEKDDGTVYGDGVNVAACLKSLTELGGIDLSGAAYDQVEGKLDLAFRFLGKKDVKNIAKAVRVYVLATLDEPQDETVAKRAGGPPDKPSIAVLPFANLSGVIVQNVGPHR